MSFILDALRKSENERRQQTAPALAAAPQAAPMKKRTIWLPVLAIVLAINAIIFTTIFLLRDEPVPVAVAPQPSTEPAVRSLRNESRADTTTAVPAGAPIPATPANRPAPTTPVTPVTKPVVVTAPAPSETIQEGLPSLGQLQAAGLVSVAELRVDMHVYSGDDAKRFVLINMKKYREGERLVEGPTIEQITPDGVIMVQQGNRFRLDRD